MARRGDRRGGARDARVGRGCRRWHNLRFRFTGCDLRGGTTGGGTVATRGPDELEVRIGLESTLAAATTLAPITAPLTFEAERLGGVRGQVTLAGRLDVAAALGAMYAAKLGAKGGADVPAWQPGGTSSILVTGPDLEDTARADRLLRGQPLGRAAGVLVLAIEQVPSEARCGGHQDAASTSLPPSAPTTKANVTAKVIARATGEVVAERSFAHEAVCPAVLVTVDGRAATVAAGPPWAELLSWLEGLSAGTPAGR